MREKENASIIIGQFSKAFLLGFLILVLLLADEGKASEEGPFPESSFSTVEGVRYHYRRFSPPEGTSLKGHVLLIHGFASSTFSWRKLYMPLTRNGYEAIAVDIPPFGFSDRSPDIDHSPVANAERLWSLMDQLGIDSLFIAGHSMGARVAGAMGTLRSEHARKVFLVDGPFFGTQKFDPGRALGAFFLKNRVARSLFESLGRRAASKQWIVRKALSYIYQEQAGEQAIEGYRRPLLIEGTAYSLPPYFLDKAPKKLPLEELQAPVHLIWGEKDPLFSHRMPERFLKRYPYEAEISVIQGAGHCPMETHPEAFLNVLSERMKGAP